MELPDNDLADWLTGRRADLRPSATRRCCARIEGRRRGDERA